MVEAVVLLNASAGLLLKTYLEKRGDLTRFFAARLRSLAAGEDLVQDMYERIVRMEPDEVVDNHSAYLYRLGVNLMLDRVRHEGRRVARETSWAQARGRRLGLLDLVDDPAADDAVDARQRLRRLIRAVDDLPPQARRAFKLHKLEGRSHAETAAAMGISRSAVEKHISAALKFLLARSS